jgi:spoIIIJ-associated protein
VRATVLSTEPAGGAESGAHGEPADQAAPTGDERAQSPADPAPDVGGAAADADHADAAAAGGDEPAGAGDDDAAAAPGAAGVTPDEPSPRERAAQETPVSTGTPTTAKEEATDVADTDTSAEPEERLAEDTSGQESEERTDALDPSLSAQERIDLLDEEAEMAADFIEGLLDRFDLPGDIEIEVHEEQALVNVQDVDSGLLIGRRGATLDALQELARCAVQRQTERRAHIRVDVEGYRARQTEKLHDKCRDAIAEVRETGEPVRLEVMDAYERKLMHNLVMKTGGVTSVSEGTEPKRRVVIHPEE